MYYRSFVLPKEIAGGDPIQTRPVLFLPDGHVLGGTWDRLMNTYFQLESVDFFKRQRPTSWGTYELSEDKAELHWIDGHTEVLEVKRDGKSLKFRGLFPAHSFPKNHRLEGEYESTGGRGGSGGDAGAHFKLSFLPDGRCRYSQVSGIKKGDSPPLIDQSIRAQGPYEIDDWRIIVTQEDGTKLVINLWTYDAEEAELANPRRFNFDNNLFQPAKTR